MSAADPTAPPNVNTRRGRGATALLHAILDQLETGKAGVAPQAMISRADDGQSGPEAKATASLGDIIDHLDERAFGILLLLLALPCCLPFVYLLPQIVSLPMLALGGQLAAGSRHPWFPQRLKARRFAIDDFRSVLSRSERYIGWIEKISKPRLSFVTSPVGLRICGLLMLAPTASIMTPLPSTNTVPGIGMAITSLGLIERDGLLVIGGLLIGFIWVALLLFLGLEAASLIKDFLTSQFFSS